MIESPDAGHPVLSAVLAGLLVLGAVAVVLVGVPSPLFDLDRHAVPKELVVHAVALLALPALAWSVHRIRLTIPEYFVLAWVLWSALSALFATNYWQAFRATGLTISAGVIFWMARRAAGGGRQRMVLAGLCGAAVIAAGTGLAQAYGVEHWIFADSRAPGGTLGNRNFLAHLSVIMLPVLLLLTLRARRALPLVLGLVGLVASVGMVSLTRSRAAWLAAAVALSLLAVAAIIARRPGGWALPAGRTRTVFLAMLVGALGALVLPNALTWRSDSPYRDTLGALVNYQDGSGHGRLIQYRNSLELVKQSPVFGTGPGNWAVEYPRVSTDGDPGFAGWAPIPTNPWPSSDWVAMISERGPVGAGLLLLAGLSMAVMGVRRLRHEDPEAAHTAATLLAVVAATAVCGAFDAVLLLAPPTLLFFASVGVLLPDAGPVFERKLSRRVTIFLLPLLVGLMTAFAGRSAAQLAAIVTAGDGRDLGRVHQASRLDPGNLRLQLIQAMRLPCNQARAHARQALRLYPHHPSVKRAVARCRAGTFT
ncbi:MAG: O-antigen ligase family protein [Gemmatimonadales bacterium]